MTRLEVRHVLHLWQRLVDTPSSLSPDDVVRAMRQRDTVLAEFEAGTLRLGWVTAKHFEALDARFVAEAQKNLTALRGAAWLAVVNARRAERRTRPWWWLDVRAGVNVFN